MLTPFSETLKGGQQRRGTVQVLSSEVYGGRHLEKHPRRVNLRKSIRQKGRWGPWEVDVTEVGHSDEAQCHSQQSVSFSFYHYEIVKLETESSRVSMKGENTHLHRDEDLVT